MDRDAFKVLAADTRVDMLKYISEHKLTLSDLSKKMGLSPSTVKEHLDKLAEAGLIEQIKSDTKWKYYRLTWKGENIVKPSGASIWVVLSTTVFGLIASAYVLAQNISPYFKNFLNKALSFPTNFPEKTLVFADDASEMAEAAPEQMAKMAEPVVNQIARSSDIVFSNTTGGGGIAEATNTVSPYMVSVGEVVNAEASDVIDSASYGASKIADEVNHRGLEVVEKEFLADVDSINESLNFVNDSLSNYIDSAPQIISESSCTWSPYDFVLDPVNIAAVFVFSICFGVLVVWGPSIWRKIKISHL